MTDRMMAAQHAIDEADIRQRIELPNVRPMNMSVNHNPHQYATVSAGRSIHEIVDKFLVSAERGVIFITPDVGLADSQLFMARLLTIRRLSKSQSC